MHAMAACTDDAFWLQIAARMNRVHRVSRDGRSPSPIDLLQTISTFTSLFA